MSVPAQTPHATKLIDGNPEERQGFLRSPQAVARVGNAIGTLLDWPHIQRVIRDASLRRDTLWSLAGGAVPLLAAVVSIPILLSRLGAEAFGVVTLLWTLMGYTGLFDFGTGRALAYATARYRGEAASDLGATLRTGLTICAVLGIVGTVALALATERLVTRWLQIGPALQGEATRAFVITSIAIVPTTVSSGIRGALEGLGRFPTSNLAKMAMGLLMFMCPLVSMRIHGPQIDLMALYLLIARVVVAAGSLWALRNELRPTAPWLSVRHAKGLSGYGFWITVSAVVSPLMVYGDRFFIAAVLGPAQMLYYAIPQEGLQRLLIIPGACASALLPRLAAAPSSVTAYRLYRSGIGTVAKAMLLACISSAFLAYPLLAIWISPVFAHTALPVTLVLIAGLWINSIAQVPLALLHARGHPHITGWFHVAELIVYILAVYLLTRSFGLIGAGIAWTVRVTLDLLLLWGAVHTVILGRETWIPRPKRTSAHD
jgi:O-antigen/teichoic acid export membrane protein